MSNSEELAKEIDDMYVFEFQAECESVHTEQERIDLIANKLVELCRRTTEQVMRDLDSGLSAIQSAEDPNDSDIR